MPERGAAVPAASTIPVWGSVSSAVAETVIDSVASASVVLLSPSLTRSTMLALDAVFPAVYVRPAKVELTFATAPMIVSVPSDPVETVAPAAAWAASVPPVGVRVTVMLPGSASATVMPVSDTVVPATTEGWRGRSRVGAFRIVKSTVTVGSGVRASRSVVSTWTLPLVEPMVPVKVRPASEALMSAMVPVRRRVVAFGWVRTAEPTASTPIWPLVGTSVT